MHVTHDAGGKNFHYKVWGWIEKLLESPKNSPLGQINSSVIISLFCSCSHIFIFEDRKIKIWAMIKCFIKRKKGMKQKKFMLIFRTHWGTLLFLIQLSPNGPMNLNLVRIILKMICIFYLFVGFSPLCLQMWVR